MKDFIQHITGLTADSRDVRKGFLFAALPGTRFDGRDFIDQAVLNGATHILAPKGTPLRDDVTMMESDNPRHEFALMAAEFYSAQPDNIVAVTGTNGKTSVADFTRQIFEMAHLKSASLGTLGLVSQTVKGENKMTTPDPVKLHALLADLKAAGVDYLAMEASSHGLHQSRLDGVKPKVVAFTNLSQDHLDYHETMGEYFAAKQKLFDVIMPEGGFAVVNIDDEYGRKLKHKHLTYGQDESATLRLVKQTPTASGQDIELSYQGQNYKIHLPLIGLFQAYNVMCAAGCCILLGMKPDFVFSCLDQLQGVAGRVELAASLDGAAAYIDYAHTPDALEKVLTALRPHVTGKLICVFGAGGDRDKGKRPKMGRVVADLADYAIVTDDNPRSENPDKIRDEILVSCPNAENIGDRRKAIVRGVELLQSGDILLIAGKGHEQGQTIGDQTLPFDDLVEAREAIKARG